MAIRGVIHFHSNYSYDGCDSIDDIVAFLKKRGCSFLFLTEHDDDFDQEKMDRFIRDCERISSSDFLIVPGIEFRCKNKVHILGLGIKNFIKVNDPCQAAEKIKAFGGRAVIAHPMGYLDHISEKLIRIVDGVEIWNGHKDGKVAPDYRIIREYSKWLSVNPGISSLCGADHHGIEGYFPIETIIEDVKNLNYPYIWDKLRAPLKIKGKYFEFQKIYEDSISHYVFLCLVRLARQAWHKLDAVAG